MKRILASLFVTSVAICSASTANAALEGTSIHSGTVPSECDVVATNATLAYATASPTVISSAGGAGNFNIKCNSTHQLTIEQLSITAPTNHPVLPTDATYTAGFSLGSSIAAINRATFTAVTVTASGLNPGEYNVSVAARGTITGAGAPRLPSGPYRIDVKATLVPS